MIGRAREATPKTDLDGMTKTQLLAFAAESGIDGVSSSMLKADILAVIKEAIM